MKNVSELSGIELNYYTCVAHGFDPKHIKIRRGILPKEYVEYVGPVGKHKITYLEGGAYALIPKYKLGLALNYVKDDGDEVWTAIFPSDAGTSMWAFRDGNESCEADGSTPCEAICRVVVKRFFGSGVKPLFE